MPSVAWLVSCWESGRSLRHSPALGRIAILTLRGQGSWTPVFEGAGINQGKTYISEELPIVKDGFEFGTVSLWSSSSPRNCHARVV